MNAVATMNTNSSKLPEQVSLYRAVTADTSQICDGRDLDKLRSSLNRRKIVEPVDDGHDGDALNLRVHKVHGGEDIVDSKVLSGYQPRARRDGCSDPAGSSQDGSRDVSSADGSGSTTHRLSSRPPQDDAAPVERRRAVSPPKLRKSRRHHSSLTSTASTSTDALNISLRKGQPARRHSITGTTLITSPYISEPSKYGTNTSRRTQSLHSEGSTIDDSLGSSARSSNAVKMRRKSEPHHRDAEFNLRLSSIMKQPKYSTGNYSVIGGDSSTATNSPCSSPPPSEDFNDTSSAAAASTSPDHFSRLLDISNHRFNLDKLGLTSSLTLPSSAREGRTTFIPLLQGLDEQSSTTATAATNSCTADTAATSSSTVVSSEEEGGEAWLPKGVEFCSSMEVYVFKPYVS
jgi:hypothetical protein